MRSGRRLRPDRLCPAVGGALRSPRSLPSTGLARSPGLTAAEAAFPFRLLSVLLRAASPASKGGCRDQCWDAERFRQTGFLPPGHVSPTAATPVQMSADTPLARN